MSITNILTVDVEDYFHAHNVAGVLDKERLANLECRIVDNTDRLLDFLAASRLEATFFVLGWVAERYPDLVRRIDRAGHEVGTHGYDHRLLIEMTPKEFERDLDRSLEILRSCVVQPIRGYRAPSFSLGPQTEWAIDILAGRGLSYDASMFPIDWQRSVRMPDGPRTIAKIKSGLFEVPVSTIDIMGIRFPCTGGAYFRLLPYAVSVFLFRLLNRRGMPVVFYMHPWEIDPDQPRFRLSPGKRLRHYTNLARMLPRLRRLVRRFRFSSVRKVVRL